MRNLATGSEIRREYEIIQEALHEKFLQASDPSITIQQYLEKMENALSSIRRIYNAKARERADISDEVLNQVQKIMIASFAVKKDLKKVKRGLAEPEDNNRSIGM